MNAWLLGGFALLAAGGAVHLIASDRDGPVSGRSAAVILKEHDAVRSRSWLEGNDPEEVAAFEREADAASQRKAELALELWRVAPDHPRVPALLHSRWLLLCNALALHAAVDEELEYFLSTDQPAAIRRVALWGRAAARLDVPALTFEQRVRALEDAARNDPRDNSVYYYANAIALHHGADMAAARDMLCWAAGRRCEGGERRSVERLLEHVERVGRPYDFDLVDARTGVAVRSADLRGGVFVLHSWRTFEGELAEALLNEVRPFRAALRARDVELISLAATVPEEGRAALVATLDRAGVDWRVLVRADAIPAPPADDPWRRPAVEWFELVAADGTLRATTAREEHVLSNL